MKRPKPGRAHQTIRTRPFAGQSRTGPTVPRVPPLVITTEMPTPEPAVGPQTGNMEFVWVPVKHVGGALW